MSTLDILPTRFHAWRCDHILFFLVALSICINRTSPHFINCLCKFSEYGSKRATMFNINTYKETLKSGTDRAIRQETCLYPTSR